MALAAKKYVITGMKKRIPDARIHITNTIVLVEHRNGYDSVIQRGDPRAEKIVSLCLIST